MSRPAETVDVLVAVPARDEQDSIGPCLASVLVALRNAAEAGVVRNAVVAIGAHRCVDRTFEAALAMLPSDRGVRGLVVRDDRPVRVGAVRSALVTLAIERLRLPVGPTSWLLSTDADSLVPADWVTSLLAIAAEERAVAVAGMVELVDWRADDTARAAYADIIAAGLTDDGHRHVYAANLAVRLDAYAEVGGFPSVSHGEEHGLVAALRLRGHRVATPRAPQVRTSGRMPGRAAAGLGALLGQLARDPVEADAETA